MAQRGQLEEEIRKLWNDRLEGSPEMLNTAFEERDITDHELLGILVRMLGATRDVVLRLAREIDQLKGTGA
jgi:hypothetical protein